MSLSRPLHALTVAGLLWPLTEAQAQTRVQILHASDLEGGVEAIDAAPNFAAIVEALEADAGQKGLTSLLLSAGDNMIPGPFFSAAARCSNRCSRTPTPARASAGSTSRS